MERHHVLYDRAAWESHPERLRLRGQQSLIIPMDEGIESQLHIAVPTVPLLDIYTAQHTRNIYVPGKTYTGSVNSLMSAIDKALRHPRTSELQRDLGGLTIMALEMQLPFIREGLITDKVGEHVQRVRRR